MFGDEVGELGNDMWPRQGTPCVAPTAAERLQRDIARPTKSRVRSPDHRECQRCALASHRLPAGAYSRLPLEIFLANHNFVVGRQSQRGHENHLFNRKPGAKFARDSYAGEKARLLTCFESTRHSSRSIQMVEQNDDNRRNYAC